MKLILLLFLTCSLLSGNVMANENPFENKIIYGYVEKATLADTGFTVSAKLDTGAKSSSLSAINIEPFKKNGLDYMRFVVPCKQGQVHMEAQYIGKVNIKARVGENGELPQYAPIKRPVVLVRIQMGKLERTIPVNLTNRKRFLYPLLLGRDAIHAFSGLVDPVKVFTLKPKEEVPKNEVK